MVKQAWIPATEVSSGEALTEADFRRIHPKLIAIFRRAGAASEDARDLAQETLLRAHRSLPAFQGHSELDTWACSIAKHVWLQHRRDRGRQKRRCDDARHEAPSPEREEADQALDLEEHLIARDRIDKARSAIAALPEVMRQALLLYVRGHKYRTIAILLGVTENHVSSLIHQAREKVRRRARGEPANSEP